MTDFVKFQRRVQARARLRVARGRGRPGPGLGGAPAEGGGAEGGADELRRPRGTGLLFAFFGKVSSALFKISAVFANIRFTFTFVDLREHLSGWRIMLG